MWKLALPTDALPQKNIYWEKTKKWPTYYVHDKCSLESYVCINHQKLLVKTRVLKVCTCTKTKVATNITNMAV